MEEQLALDLGKRARLLPDLGPGAVLLEGFVVSMAQTETGERMEEEAREQHKAAGVLDPLLATLAAFDSPTHLKGQLADLFDRC